MTSQGGLWGIPSDQFQMLRLCITPRPGRRGLLLRCGAIACTLTLCCQSEAQVQRTSDLLASPIAEELRALPPVDRVNAISDELNIDWLVSEVLARNPDVRAAVAAWTAAAARYPQAVSLEDPMFGFLTGPGSWGDPTVTSAYMVEASQKIPWPGKRQLRGSQSTAAANAEFHSIDAERLRVAAAARIAYYDFYSAERQKQLLDKTNILLESFRKIAADRYEAAAVEQQDVLLADVELARLQTRQQELNRAAFVARARINTLLLQPANSPLAVPPTELAALSVPESSTELIALAILQRPELAAQQARVRAERYGAALACKEYYPDFEILGRYDAFWQEEPLRPMVGMNLNIPLYQAKRHAAVREARAKITAEQARLDSMIAELTFEIEQAHRRLEESQQSLDVYTNRLLPAAKQSVEAARASYVAGKLDFLRLIEAQRQSLDIQAGYYELVAEQYRRATELDRVAGNALSTNP